MTFTCTPPCSLILILTLPSSPCTVLPFCVALQEHVDVSSCHVHLYRLHRGLTNAVREILHAWELARLDATSVVACTAALCYPRGGAERGSSGACVWQ